MGNKNLTSTNKKSTILVVDDSPANLQILTDILNTRFKVLIANNGPKAIQLANQHPQPDIILLDIIMPEMDGYEVCKHIKQNPKTSDIPIIFVTAQSAEESETKGFSLGAADYVTKPLRPTVILTRIETQLALQRTKNELLMAKEKAEEATRLKDKFVTLVAHDLRAPLSSIVGLVECVVEDEEYPLHEDHHKLLSNAVSSGWNLTNMIEEILNISRLQSGKITLKKTFFDSHFLIAEILNRLDPMRSKKELVIQNQIPENTRIFADRSLLGEVLQNLIANAIKFSHPLQTIKLYIPEHNNALISIQDEGVGIPEETRPKLFLVEEKISTTGTLGERGTGFGLPFSYDIMKAHGGNLTVESTPEQGTTFHLHIKALRPKIMIVENNKTQRASMVLTSPNLEISEASDSNKALALLKKNQHHLIIIDAIMPILDGFQLLSSIKSDSKLEHIPVIMLTDAEELKTKERALRMGASDVLIKPIAPHDILPRIRHFLDNPLSIT